ncbi:MAG: tetratricopeptide repeat protein [Alphaproteobacteria bacterium]
MDEDTDAKALMAKAAAAHQKGDLATAKRLYDVLLARDDAPRASVHANLSVLALVQGDYPTAEKHARSALEVNPEDPNSYNNLGLALKHRGRTDESIDAFRACVKRNPHHHLAWSNLAGLLSRLKRIDEAVEAASRAVELAPDDPNSVETALQTKLDACDWSDIDTLIGRCQKLVGAGAKLNPYLLMTFCVDPAELLRANRSYAAGIAREAAALPRWQPPAMPNTGKIRVGFYSLTMRDHATGYLVKEMLERYDRDRFRFVCYSYARPSGDAYTKNLVGLFDRVVDLSGLSDFDAVKVMRDDRMDVMLDVDGYANGGRPAIMAARCAPAQVNWLGYPGTLGAPYLDYIIGDDGVIPDGFDRFFQEHVIRLPGGYFPNDSGRPVSDRFKSRADLGLPEDAVVLCGFNQPRKITAPTLRAWGSVLHHVPEAVLWLWQVNDVAPRNIRATLEAWGIDPKRAIFTPSMAPPDHLCRYQFADLFVDTFPYTGHTMASDALFMGTPTVTLEGKTFASRVAASMLRRLDMADWIATDLEGYTKRIARLATDPALRRDVRVRLAAAKERTRQFSGARYVADFQNAMAEIARRVRASEAHGPFVADGHGSGGPDLKA